MRFPTLLFGCLLALTSPAAPLKVYILVGQSNMEGHARISTFDYIGDDPQTAPLLKQMLGPDGKPAVCDHVWISNLTKLDQNMEGEGTGKLTAGYGSRADPTKLGEKIGPEFTFGLALDRKLKEPVLIIKAAWGGKSLFHDFRPPSAGVYPRTPKDLAQQRFLEADSGKYYSLMMAHVKAVLANPQRVCPAYTGQGLELAGFVWFQGWNDMVTREVYPEPVKGATKPRYDDYSVWLGDFIRDVRKDLNAPKLPFVIGVMGVDGAKPGKDIAAFRLAMAAPAAWPEFRGNVFAVQTAPFWDEALGAIDAKRAQVRQMGFLLKSKSSREANAKGDMTEAQQRAYLKEYEAKLISSAEVARWNRGASNGGYHYLGCAKTFALMGEAFANALVK